MPSSRCDVCKKFMPAKDGVTCTALDCKKNTIETVSAYQQNYNSPNPGPVHRALEKQGVMKNPKLDRQLIEFRPNNC